MKNKRGQFYIVAAIIIVLVLTSLTTIKTYANIKSNPQIIENIGSNLKVETPKIIDYGVYNGNDTNSLMGNFSSKDFAAYFLTKTDYANAVFVYGNKDGLHRVNYTKGESGTIELGGTIIQLKNSKVEVGEITLENKGKDSVEVEILKKKHKFKLKDNQIFYFIITKEENGENYIERN